MKKSFYLISLLSFSILISCSPEEQPTTSPFLKQLEIDIEIIDNYLSENEIEAEIDGNGIRYVIHETGTGVYPDLSDRIVVRYEGRYLSGEVFDDNLTSEIDLNGWPLGGLISSWQIMLPYLKEGGRMTFYSPSGYCYGKTAYNGIPANSIMIFYIELIDVVEA